MDLPHDWLDGVVGAGLVSVNIREAIVGQRLADSLFSEIGNLLHLQEPQYVVCCRSVDGWVDTLRVRLMALNC